jgi:hypothetical protein
LHYFGPSSVWVNRDRPAATGHVCPDPDIGSDIEGIANGRASATRAGNLGLGKAGRGRTPPCGTARRMMQSIMSASRVSVLDQGGGNRVHGVGMIGKQAPRLRSWHKSDCPRRRPAPRYFRPGKIIDRYSAACASKTAVWGRSHGYPISSAWPGDFAQSLEASLHGPHMAVEPPEKRSLWES